MDPILKSVRKKERKMEISFRLYQTNPNQYSGKLNSVPYSTVIKYAVHGRDKVSKRLSQINNKENTFTENHGLQKKQTKLKK